jgi:hypothetical protein
MMSHPHYFQGHLDLLLSLKPPLHLIAALSLAFHPQAVPKSSFVHLSGLCLALSW